MDVTAAARQHLSDDVASCFDGIRQACERGDKPDFINLLNEAQGKLHDQQFGRLVASLRALEDTKLLAALDEYDSRLKPQWQNFVTATRAAPETQR